MGLIGKELAAESRNGDTAEKKRAYIPATAPKGFLDCHWVYNYDWIFDLQLGRDGYVKKR